MPFRPAGFERVSDLLESVAAAGVGSAGALKSRWDVNASGPSSSDEIHRWAWIDNVDAERRAMILQYIPSRWLLELFDSTDTRRIRLDAGSSDGYITFYATKARVSANDGSSPLVLEATMAKLGELGSTRTPVAVPLTNKTGGSLAVGDVVILDTANDDAVKLAAAASDPVPMVVVEGGAANAVIWVARAGKVSTVTMETTPAVARGDTIVASATAKQGKVDNAQARPKLILGWALTTKAASTAGSVAALLL